jgi:hypothetical protein
MGEPLVNLYNGILFFSGTTGGDYTPFVDPSNATSGGTYFEVGSNLYNLQLRNKITEYQGETTNLAGKFLSGTTTGFVLANISDIAASTNTYVTGGTWTPNTLTLGLNDGSSASPITIDTFNNLSLYGTTNVNGNLTVTGTSSLQGVTATNVNATNLYASSTLSAVTGNITTVNSSTINTTNLNVTGTEIVNNLTITGTGLYNTTATGTNPFEIVNYTSLTAFSQTKEVYVTGITLSQSATTSNNNQTYNLTYRGTPLETTNYTITVKDTFVTGGTYDTSNGTITFVKNDATSFQVTGIDGMDTFVTGGTITTAPSNSDNDGVIGLKYNQNVPDGTYTLPFTDTFVTGGTYSNGTITFSYNDSGKTPFQVTGIDGTDTYVTGFTYDSASNKLTISRNQGEPDLPVYINSFSGLSISNLTSGQVVYVGSDGKLKTESDFLYNDGSNTLTIGTTSGKLVVNNGISDGPSTFGQGGVTIGSGGSHSTPGIGDLIVHGNFIVFGTGTTVATNELYVEDPQITLNYNPTGNTSSTSIASGIRVQDGSGTQGTDTYFTVSRLDTLTGLTGNQVPVVTEYTAGGVGNDNRGWLTQLNDIVIRNTNLNNGAPNGVRVLAEFDTLDGGQY